jgi:hypothetical protein
MKLVIRLFALCVVVAGVAAAATTSKVSTVVFASRQSATASMPSPCCGGHMACPVQTPNN